MNPYQPYDALACAWWHRDSFKQDKLRRQPARIDMLIGYGLGANLAGGWWELQRNMFREPTGKQFLTLIHVHPRLVRVLGETLTLRAWRKGGAIMLRDHAFGLVNLPRLRAQLENDTGYRELHTIDEIIDASRALKHDSIGSRALLTIIDTPIWPVPPIAPLALTLERIEKSA